MSSNAKKIWVGRKFADLLNRGHDRINEALGDMVNKDISFIDYTDFLANLMDDDFELILSRGVFAPIKKGRRSKKVELRTLSI